MLKIQVNDKYNFEVINDKNAVLINGQELEFDLQHTATGYFHILIGTKSFNAELVDINRSEKTAAIRVNSSIYTIAISDQFDELLRRLGMDNVNSNKVSELKAPMPGLVLKVLVEEGAEISKGQNLLVLEAMKMENIIKSPADLIVKSIKVKPSDKLEKNQVMIVFE